MANIFSSFKIKSAVNSRNTFDNSSRHITTIDFGQLLPIFSESLIPGDKIEKFNPNVMLRTFPLKAPTYGDLTLDFVNIFIPYRLINDDFEDYITCKDISHGNVPHGRFITLSNIISFLNTFSSSSNTPDFTFIHGTAGTQKRKFTPLGRYFYKILNMLGYYLPQQIDLTKSDIANYKFNANKLLCLFKGYFDWFSQSTNYDVNVVGTILDDIKYLRTSRGYISSNGNISLSALTALFNNYLLSYDNDYFTSAFQSPIAAFENVNLPPSPTNSIYNNLESNENIEAVLSGKNTTPWYRDGIESGRITSFGINALMAFDKWLRRRNYSGSRSVEQLFSRFGIKVSEYRSKYSTYLNRSSVDINIGDVTNTNGASGSTLGSYAGKMLGAGTTKSSTFECDDYGMFMCIAFLHVKPFYFGGTDKENLRLKPLDYFTPEYENLGPSPITFAELRQKPFVGDDDEFNMNKVFGFIDRYADYKVPHDRITGDMTMDDMMCYHFGRDTSVITYNELKAQSSNVIYQPVIGNQFRRIFADTTDDFDHFYPTFYFDYVISRPMESLNQSLNLGDGELVVPRNGNQIN